MSTRPSASTSESRELYVVVQPGLEPLARQEIQALGIKDIRQGKGGLTVRGSLETAARLNLWLRTASRVVARVGTFDAPGRRELAARARRFDWAAYVLPASRLRIHVSCESSRLYHTGLVAEVLHEALGTSPADNASDAPLLLVRIHRDRCTLSFDTSGELLYKRGARLEISRAPLRETLASGLLLWAGYTGDEPLLDPMCGSGALLLEGAAIATRRAPGLGRSFALASWPSFDLRILKTLREEARALIRPPPAPIWGSDTHAGAIAQAQRNAERGELQDAIQFERADVGERTSPATTGLAVVNPPWGKRVHADSATVGALRFAFSETLCAWRQALIAPPTLARKLLPTPPTDELVLSDGGLRVVFARTGAMTHARN